MKIEMPRGDIFPVRFTVSNPDGTICQTDFTEIYMTCKRDANEDDFLFQKTLTHGDIIKLGAGDYQFKIMPEDTNELAFGDYVFDIEIIYENEIKQTTFGTLTLSREATSAKNEVS